MPSSRSPITDYLAAWRNGDPDALDRLIPLVYDTLRRMAGRHLRGERDAGGIQATALVHEAYLRLVGADVPWADRGHFYAVAARVMRRLLVDHARERSALKRGGGWVRTTLDTGIVISGPPPLELVELDRALQELEARDPRAAQAAELHYFAGLSYEDTARALEVSTATIHRDLRFARAWLQRSLGDS